MLPVLELNLPDGQAVHWESSSTSLYLPTGQTSQVPPAAAWPDPAGHVVSEVQPVWSMLDKVPSAQVAQEASPEEEV